MHICHHGGFLEHQPSFTEWWTAHSRLPPVSRMPHPARSNSWGWGLAVGTPPLPQGHCKGCIAGDWCYWVVAGASFIYPFYLMFTHLRFTLRSTLPSLASPSIKASSVPCKHLFSASKQTAVDRRVRLDNQKFEQLQLLKFAWCTDIPDLAASNEQANDIIDLSSYKILHYQDVAESNLDNELGDDYVFLTGDLELDNWTAFLYSCLSFMTYYLVAWYLSILCAR